MKTLNKKTLLLAALVGASAIIPAGLNAGVTSISTADIQQVTRCTEAEAQQIAKNMPRSNTTRECHVKRAQRFYKQMKKATSAQNQKQQVNDSKDKYAKGKGFISFLKNNRVANFFYSGYSKAKNGYNKVKNSKIVKHVSNYKYRYMAGTAAVLGSLYFLNKRGYISETVKKPFVKAGGFVFAPVKWVANTRAAKWVADSRVGQTVKSVYNKATNVNIFGDEVTENTPKVTNNTPKVENTTPVVVNTTKEVAEKVAENTTKDLAEKTGFSLIEWVRGYTAAKTK